MNWDGYQKPDDLPALGKELTQPDNFCVVTTMLSSRGVIFQSDSSQQSFPSLILPFLLKGG